jgi:DNA-binding transcriptional ArsR family regulator
VASRIARRAHALADPRRVQILALLKQAPASVGELALQLELRPARASLLLSILREAELVRAERRGRCRLYSTDGDLADALLADLLPAGTAGTTRPMVRAPGLFAKSPLRLARSCYDHLAGARSIELTMEMERRHWIVPTAAGFLVTAIGERQLLRRGVDVAMCREARRKFAPACLDWTERRPHLGGSVGREIFRCLQSAGYVRRGPGRVVDIRRPLIEWFRG